MTQTGVINGRFYIVFRCSTSVLTPASLKPRSRSNEPRNRARRDHSAISGVCAGVVLTKAWTQGAFPPGTTPGATGASGTALTRFEELERRVVRADTGSMMDRFELEQARKKELLPSLCHMTHKTEAEGMLTQGNVDFMFNQKKRQTV